MKDKKLDKQRASMCKGMEVWTSMLYSSLGITQMQEPQVGVTGDKSLAGLLNSKGLEGWANLNLTLKQRMPQVFKQGHFVIRFVLGKEFRSIEEDWRPEANKEMNVVQMSSSDSLN